jgi:hypothetical protein
LSQLPDTADSQRYAQNSRNIPKGVIPLQELEMRAYSIINSKYTNITQNIIKLQSMVGTQNSLKLKNSAYFRGEPNMVLNIQASTET